VLTLPPGAEVLAKNAFEPHQAFRVGRVAWGVQFHPEYSADIMRSYVWEQSRALEAGGRDVDAIHETIRDTPQAAGLLQQFTKIAREN
jgi:GMP synthase (glutamine-hydrolysing)